MLSNRSLAPTRRDDKPVVTTTVDPVSFIYPDHHV
jgi:hypothetical protein